MFPQGSNSKPSPQHAEHRTESRLPVSPGAKVFAVQFGPRNIAHAGGARDNACCIPNDLASAVSKTAEKNSACAWVVSKFFRNAFRISAGV
jgi:hypothetical protein